MLCIGAAVQPHGRADSSPSNPQISKPNPTWAGKELIGQRHARALRHGQNLRAHGARVQPAERSSELRHIAEPAPHESASPSHAGSITKHNPFRDSGHLVGAIWKKRRPLHLALALLVPEGGGMRR